MPVESCSYMDGNVSYNRTSQQKKDKTKNTSTTQFTHETLRKIFSMDPHLPIDSYSCCCFLFVFFFVFCLFLFTCNVSIQFFPCSNESKCCSCCTARSSLRRSFSTRAAVCIRET